MTKSRKFLVETSAARAAIGLSTDSHNQAVAQVLFDGTLWTSVYIRKEFIRRWICYYLHAASVVEQYVRPSDAFKYLNQAFSIRDVKTLNDALIALLEQKVDIDDARSVAKELVHLANGELRKFDRKFVSRIPNSSGCRLGGKEFRVDFRNVFNDVRQFLEYFEIQPECKIEEFLGIKNPKGAASRLLACADVDSTTAGKKLADFFAKGREIECKKCGAIGDIVIALEQPKPFCLVHIDRDFDVLCAATGRNHFWVPSLRSVEDNSSETHPAD